VRAVRRDGIDTEVVELQSRLANVKPITAGDPGAVMVVGALTGLSESCQRRREQILSAAIATGSRI
jgi:hypothetical protein